MPDFINSETLKSKTDDLNKKYKSTVYLKKNCYLAMESLMAITNCSSRNDVIEKAVSFYFGYITSQLNQDYLCDVYGAKIEGMVNNLARCISNGNFRIAVESDMLTRMLAAEVQINKSEYDKLRLIAIKDVKRTNGSINILEAIEESEDDVEESEDD